MQSVVLEVDVRDLGSYDGALGVAATLFAPDAGVTWSGELLVCLHGATCDQRYFHAQFDRHKGYSFAEFFTARGDCVLAIDHLGMGASARPEPEALLSTALVAAANDRVMREALAGLRAGRWFGGAGAAIVRISGVAHSMGGMLGIIQQARHRSFDRLAILGWSNIGVRIKGDQAGDARQLVVHQGYLPAPRALMRALFHAADVPNDLIEEDDARASLTPAGLGRAAMAPGIVSDEAAQLQCPLLILYGDVDTSPDPAAEVAYYRAAPEITLVRLAGAAHMHNLASSRVAGWQRLAAWLAAI